MGKWPFFLRNVSRAFASGYMETDIQLQRECALGPSEPGHYHIATPDKPKWFLLNYASGEVTIQDEKAMSEFMSQGGKLSLRIELDKEVTVPRRHSTVDTMTFVLDPNASERGVDLEKQTSNIVATASALRYPSSLAQVLEQNFSQ